MKALLNAIKSELQTKIDYARNNDINVVPHENYIEHSFKQNYIGLKDGAIRRKELSGGLWEVTMDVKIILYVQLAKDEAAIMGDTSTNKKGILDMAKDIHTALDENLLDLSGMQKAFSPDENESRIFGDENETLQQKIITYQYIKEEPRANKG